MPLLRQLDDYLHILRQQVPRQALQAVFVLVSQDCPERYSRLDLEERLALQRRLQTLISESCCLLTVEQLLLEARKLQVEFQRARKERRRKMLAALERLKRGEEPTESSEESSGPASDSASGPSVEEPSGQSSDQSSDGSSGVEGLILSVQEQPEEDTTLPLVPPKDPQGLERWCLWLRQAMVYHLRTLSHQLNVELLKHRLIQAVLPVKLLDAVLAGDLEAMQAPENVLKISVPMGSEENAPQVVTCVLLLRLPDMEFAYRPLRESRGRWQKYQKELRNLVTQSEHWQKRLVMNQAMADWNNDLQQIQSPQRA